MHTQDPEEKDKERKKQARLENAMPPAFYDDDMHKWNEKFRTAREERQLDKAKMKSLGCFRPTGTKNENV